MAYGSNSGISLACYECGINIENNISQILPPYEGHGNASDK